MILTDQSNNVSVRRTGDEAMPAEQARWDAVVERNRLARGAFVYAVTTTGVYCRPGCASRRPRRENVRFFDTREQAERAGYRPCKRCSPDALDAAETHLAAIVQACKTIDESFPAPSLNALAAAAGLSPFYFQRLFKRITGITPKQYALERRQGRVRANLRRDATVTLAAYNAGFASSSRFYDETTDSLGMKPSDYRDGARGVSIRYAIAPSYLGWALVAATARGVCAIHLGDSPENCKRMLQAQFPNANLLDGDAEMDGWVSTVLAFLESPRRGFDLPLDIQGTAFQRRVWNALQQIPAGETATYTDIAVRIGQPTAARAVAHACAANPAAVAIPCHRVRRGDGQLGGYRWGLDRKRALLAREGEANA